MKLKEIKKSDKPAKKFMAIFQKEDGKEKKIYFGATGYRDFTLMNDPKSEYYEPDKEKREKVKDRYQKRHRRYLSTADNPKGHGAAALSFYVLWTKPTLKGGIANYKKQFKH